MPTLVEWRDPPHRVWYYSVPEVNDMLGTRFIHDPRDDWRHVMSVDEIFEEVEAVTEMGKKIVRMLYDNLGLQAHGDKEPDGSRERVSGEPRA